MRTLCSSAIAIERCVSVSRDAVELAMRDLPAGRLRVGFSGGMDSTVLLHAALRHLEKAGGKARLTAHHLNHGLIPSAEEMALHCRSIAQGLGVAFECDDIEVSETGNMEAGARKARYARWGEVLASDETLLLAHHADDQAETLLMRLMRGAPAALLRAMPRERTHAKGRLLRPLLLLPRAHLREYADAHDLTWFEDPSNQDATRDRNFIRHQVLPALVNRWPDAVRSMSRSMTSLEAELQGREALIASGAEAARVDEHSLSVEHLLALPEALRTPVLRRSLADMGVHAISDAHLKAMLMRLTHERFGEFSFGSDLKLARFDGRLVLRQTSEVKINVYYQWRFFDPLHLSYGELRAEPNAMKRGACLDQGIEACRVRFRAGGERLRVRGSSKKVSRLLQEACVPPWQRTRWPLICLGDDLVSVAGIAVDDAFAKDEGWLIEWSPR